jgi:hypothetical protein
MELFKASQQWSTRPDDEKFNDLQTAYEQSLAYAKSSREKEDVDPATLRVEAYNSEVQLVGKGNEPATLTNWAFGQLAARIEAPASYLRKLPATLAVQNINHGLKTRYTDPNERVNLLVHANGGLVVRALTSEKYARIWNHDLLRRMLDYPQYGWNTPVAFEYMNANIPIYVGGRRTREKTIYVSDHDMFVFLVNNNNRINEPGNPEGLGRGFFVENSEVGASKLRITTFLYRFICSNHIVWGAKDVSEIALRHVGKVRGRIHQMFDRLHIELNRYANESVSDIEAKIRTAKSTIIAAHQEQVIDTIFANLKKAGAPVSRKQLEAAQTLAIANESTDGKPNSIWGMAQGLTRLSQDQPFADVRLKMDEAAGRLIDMAF